MVAEKKSRRDGGDYRRNDDGGELSDGKVGEDYLGGKKCTRDGSVERRRNSRSRAASDQSP